MNQSLVRDGNDVFTRLTATRPSVQEPAPEPQKLPKAALQDFIERNYENPI